MTNTVFPVYIVRETMNAGDAQIVEQCRGGDIEAFAELVRRHQDAVFNLVWSMTGNWHEAADITQETFIRAYRKLPSYKSEYAFKNWVLSIGANLTKNRFRSWSRQQRLQEKLAGMQELKEASPDEPHDE
ncbi:MAG: sigma-70 family RNA polymerase sigma factor, partial [Verrucomicrobia bacterium]|nr:sigma-70 family RNA polymerase sigma factor [Verrucomicrobiota bacterium]